VLYLIRGMWYAPKKEKFMGGIMLLKKRAPILGGNSSFNAGNFAIWAGLFSATDCALISLRKKEDSINQIVAGAVTGGLLAFRAGARVAFKNAIFGGMMLGSIVIVEKIMMKMHKK
jgi:import inner membrane translocase subunit TIM17